MGAINSVPRWNPFGLPPALPPSKPAAPAHRRRRGAGDVANGDGGAASDRDRRTSLSSESNRNLGASSEGGGGGGRGLDDHRSNSKIMGQSAPPLYENALVGEWSALKSRALTHPSEAEYTDRRCNTAIHLACRRQPTVEVVRALLKADPAGAGRVTVDGMMPLHFAAYCGAEGEVVRLLLDASSTAAAAGGSAQVSGAAVAGGRPQSAPQSQSSSSAPTAAAPLDRRGRTPLHLALSGFRTPHRPDVVSLLLRCDPSGSTKTDERGRTPLSLLYDDYAEEVEDALGAAVSDEEARKMCLDEEGELRECWTILNLLLQAAYHGTVPEPAAARARAAPAQSTGDHDGGAGEEEEAGAETAQAPSRPSAAGASAAAARLTGTVPAEVDLLNGPYRPLHAAVGVYETPPKFVRLMLRVLPDAVMEKDGDFNLPLHLAAKAVPAEFKRQRGRAALRGVTTTASTQTPEVAGGPGGGVGASTQWSGVIMRGARGSIGGTASSGTIGGVGGAGGSVGRVYNADFGRGSGGSIHRGDSGDRGSGHGGGANASSAVDPGSAAAKKKGPAHESTPHTAISDLINSYPEAASVPDESGRYALVLAIESGKSWEWGVRPILEAYPNAFDGSALAVVQSALVGALTSSVRMVREETGRTVAGISTRWGGNDGRREDDGSDVDEADWSDPEDDFNEPKAKNSGDGEVDDDSESKGKGKKSGDDGDRNNNDGGNNSEHDYGVVGEDQKGGSSTAVSFVNELVRMAGRCGSPNARRASTSSNIGSSMHGGSRHGATTIGGGVEHADEWVGIQSATLEALAGLYTNIPKRCLTLPGSAEAGLNVSVDMLRHEDEAVRESAAKCVGSALELLGGEAAQGVVQDILDQHRPKKPEGRGQRRRSLSRRFSGSALSGVTGASGRSLLEDERTDDESDLDESTLARHGRAAAVYRVLSSSVGLAVSEDTEMFRGCTFLVRDLMLDDEVSVRRAACIAVGAVLDRSPDPAATLREVRKTISKCMRATEDEGVHVSLARGLILARRNKPEMFLCKAGMPILDGALMLAVSSAITPPVQRMFHGFLWLALGVGEQDDGKGLAEYMKLAEGENGRIMMTLVTKTLSKIEHVEEDRW